MIGTDAISELEQLAKRSVEQDLREPPTLAKTAKHLLDKRVVIVVRDVFGDTSVFDANVKNMIGLCENLLRADRDDAFLADPSKMRSVASTEDPDPMDLLNLMYDIKHIRDQGWTVDVGMIEDKSSHFNPFL